MVQLPGNVLGLWDPLASAGYYRSCALHPTRLPPKQDGLPRTRPPSVREAYYMAFQEDLTDAHDALADAVATARVIAAAPSLWKTRLLTKGAVQYDVLHASKTAKLEKLEAEVKRPVPDGWKEGDKAHEVPDKEYTGPCYGPAGPARTPMSAVKLFLNLVSLQTLATFAEWSNMYAVGE